MGVKQLAHLRAKELTSRQVCSQVAGHGADLRPQGPGPKSGGSQMGVRDAGEGQGAMAEALARGEHGCPQLLPLRGSQRAGRTGCAVSPRAEAAGSPCGWNEDRPRV